MKKIVLITALTGLVFALQSHAAGQHRKGLGSELSKKDKAERVEKRLQKRIEKLDTSNDGQIDLNEYLQHAEKRFRTTDTNSDGYISKQEMRAFGKEMRQQIKAARAARKAARQEAEAAE